MKDKIRFGMLGCGRIATAHFKAISELGDRCEITAVCDSDMERAREAAEATGARPYTSYEKMLEDGGFDVVIITTPSGLHPEQGIKAAKAGCHVVTEKPMGLTLESVDDLIRTCDRENKHLFVIKQNRLCQSMQLLKHAIELNRFGRIYFSQVNVFWTRPQDYYDAAKWRGTWEFDGGAFMNQASHYIDLMYWLVGEVDHVEAITGTLARKIETEDTGAAILRFRNGAIGSINVTMLTYQKNFEGSITILGEKGTVKIGGKSLNNIEHWEFADYNDDDRIIIDSNYNLSASAISQHGAYYKNVLDVLEGKSKDPVTDGRSGRKAMELILAINKSAREGCKVPLPLEK